MPELKWVCRTCGLNPHAMVILKDELWLTIAAKKDILCFKCIEAALGRRLTWDDLKENSAIAAEHLIGVSIYDASSASERQRMNHLTYTVGIR